MIGGLIHLRYLDLSHNEELKELPDAVGDLYNLQTLRLVGCSGLEKVDVGRLINLRHLYVKACWSLVLIKGIEKLTNLQTLDEFMVSAAGDEGTKLEHLKDLNQLQGTFKIYNPKGAAMAESASVMVKKAHLRQLSLHNGNREIMNALEPHQNLDSLVIYCYEGEAFSHWLSSLHSLRELTLVLCCKVQVLPPLGKLPSLETLCLGLSKVSKVGVEFLGIDDGPTSTSSSNFKSFPKLKQLNIKVLTLWEEWEEVETKHVTIMPCLSELRIEFCDKLKALPEFLWKTPLQKLHISKSPTLLKLYRQQTGEEWAKISHIASIDICSDDEDDQKE